MFCGFGKLCVGKEIRCGYWRIVEVGNWIVKYFWCLKDLKSGGFYFLIVLWGIGLEDVY